VAVRDRAAQDGFLCVMINRLARVRGAEGFRRGEQVDGLQPVRLALRVRAVDDIEAGGEFDGACEVAEADRLDALKVHSLAF
jgi:hypothetical protein